MKSLFDKIKKSFGTKTFAAGGYSIVAILLIVAIAVAFNLLIGSLPSTVTKLDTTQNQMYSLSEASKKIAQSVEDDITIYWLVRTGREDDAISILLDRYAAESDHITVKKIDPDIYPTFYQKYTDSYSENSLVFENGDRTKYVDYDDIYEYSYVYDSSSYYGYSTEVNFDGENEITSAIDYVISEDLPKMYYLTGHGESELSSSYQSAVESENFLTEELTLITSEAVPEDATILLINDPQSDISTEEAEKIATYLTGGGSLCLITSPLQDVELTNIVELMKTYGLELQEGIVVEGNQNYYAWGRPFYLVPDLSTHDITYDLYSEGYYVLLPIAQGLKINEDASSSATITEVLYTSDDAFSKVAGYSMTSYAKEDGDIDGPFALAAAVEDGDTYIFWCTSAGLVDDSSNQSVSGGNMDTFLNAINWLCGDSESKISIRAKSFSTTKLSLTSSSATGLTALMMVIIPLLFIGVGLFIWIKRRHK